MKKKIICISLALLSLLWIFFIFSNSLEDSVESGAKSTWVYNLIHSFLPWVSKLFIRKMGHFAEFAILGALLSSTIFAAISPISKAEAKKLLPLFYALPGTFVVGCIDELLQNLSEGRHPAFTDVLIDTSGGLFGIAAVLTALLFIRHIKAKKKD